MCDIALEEGQYKTVGQVIAYSIAHNGPLPGFFSELLYGQIAELEVMATISDVHDQDIAEQLTKVCLIENLVN